MEAATPSEAAHEWCRLLDPGPIYMVEVVEVSGRHGVPKGPTKRFRLSAEVIWTARPQPMGVDRG